LRNKPNSEFEIASTAFLDSSKFRRCYP